MNELFDIVPDYDKSEGCYLHDKATDQKFLDFYGMWSSQALGYNHPIFDKSYDELVKKYSRVKVAINAFNYDETYQLWKKAFRHHVFSDNIHLCNSGSLAVEAALKSALDIKQNPKGYVYSLTGAFHGIGSWGEATDWSKCNKRLILKPGTIFGPKNIETIFEGLHPDYGIKVAAVIVELIQCTYGDIEVNVDHLKSIQRKCAENDVCFIIDEIQTGFGVTGSMWYYQRIGLDDPDILVFGKKAQVSGIVTNDKYAGAMRSPHKKLSTTFDGDMIDVIRSLYVTRAYVNDPPFSQVKYNEERLEEFFERFELPHRVFGNLASFDLPDLETRDKVWRECFKERLLVNTGGERSIRLRPNMSVTDQDIKEAKFRIESALVNGGAIK